MFCHFQFSVQRGRGTAKTRHWEGAFIFLRLIRGHVQFVPFYGSVCSVRFYQTPSPSPKAYGNWRFLSVLPITVCIGMLSYTRHKPCHILTYRMSWIIDVELWKIICQRTTTGCFFTFRTHHFADSALIYILLFFQLMLCRETMQIMWFQWFDLNVLLL